MDNFFVYGKSRHKVKDRFNVKGQDKVSGQYQASGSNVDTSIKNYLQQRDEQESSPHVVSYMLQVLSIDVYVLLDSGATLSLVTPLLARKFDILLDILNEPFMVTTAEDESVVAMKIFKKNCPNIDQ